MGRRYHIHSALCKAFLKFFCAYAAINHAINHLRRMLGPTTAANGSKPGTRRKARSERMGVMFLAQPLPACPGPRLMGGYRTFKFFVFSQIRFGPAYI